MLGMRLLANEIETAIIHGNGTCGYRHNEVGALTQVNRCRIHLHDNLFVGRRNLFITGHTYKRYTLTTRGSRLVLQITGTRHIFGYGQPNKVSRLLKSNETTDYSQVFN